MNIDTIHDKINKTLTISQSVPGAGLFLIADGKRRVIITGSVDDIFAVKEHMDILGEDYQTLDMDNERTLIPKLTRIVRDGSSVIALSSIKEHKFPSRESLLSSSLTLQRGMQTDRDALLGRLDQEGFERKDNVYERGEYAVRGFIIDIYDNISEPVRIEMYGDKIESIRLFSIEKQSSMGKLDKFILPPADIEKVQAFSEFFENYSIFDMDNFLFGGNTDTDKNENFVQQTRTSAGFKEMIARYPGYGLNIFTSSGFEHKRLSELFPSAHIHKGHIYSSCIIHAAKMFLINDFDIFGRDRIYNRRALGLPSVYIEDIEDLSNGDLVVHENYGIGRYAGIERVTLGSRVTDCLKIYYKDNDRVFVPVDQINLVDKYHAPGSQNAALSPLSKGYFEKKKKKIKRGLKKIAGELLRVYAEREMSDGFAFNSDCPEQIEMEEQFVFEETPDQIEAIEDIKHDMESPRPMERVICGEVGYGKTEVAARAIFKAYLSGKQSILLVPTTILAEQHFRTLTERFSDFDITVEMLSRFRTLSEKRHIKTLLKEGSIDLIIGTHALLSDDVEYSDPGLLIIDEEHRFGVKQKDKIKEIKRHIDVLYMSATPIPRTLEMIFSGIKDISNILTPPSGRKPVKTDVMRWNDSIIRNAVIREINRGGQVYFVHNRIGSLRSVRTKLESLIPGINVISAHAKLPSRKLENIMLDFWEQRYDVLLSTAIIESGIDNPATNTMIINNGERFGIAQLHQLRGRIGRSHRDAFCYVIISDEKNLTDNAKRRLMAFKSFSSLGAGFKLAMKDLEIRGAGNLLGTKQHGNIGIVGFSLYYKLLKQAIEEVRGIKTMEVIEPTVSIPVKTYIPDDFPLSASGKSKLYREINDIDKADKFSDAKKKFIDRYGSMPREIENMFVLRQIKLFCREARISAVKSTGNKLIIEFLFDYSPPKAILNKLISGTERQLEIKYENPFRIIIDSRDMDIRTIRKLLKNAV
ncbi:MAG: transcription-repair coupling factor [candidate division WOR-3 bacterium]|nr:transcription-repair coupling factor [candidate division WOR-3 bacterium]